MSGIIRRKSRVEANQGKTHHDRWDPVEVRKRRSRTVSKSFHFIPVQMWTTWNLPYLLGMQLSAATLKLHPVLRIWSKTKQQSNCKPQSRGPQNNQWCHNGNHYFWWAVTNQLCQKPTKFCKKVPRQLQISGKTSTIFHTTKARWRLLWDDVLFSDCFSMSKSKIPLVESMNSVIAPFTFKARPRD